MAAICQIQWNNKMEFQIFKIQFATKFSETTKYNVQYNYNFYSETHASLWHVVILPMLLRH